MSYLLYFSDIFHNFGDLSIDLDNAFNTIVRSFRTDVPENDKKSAKEKILNFLSIPLEEEKEPALVMVRQIREVLGDFIAERELKTKLQSIRIKIESGEKLSEKEINILDDLISKISYHATIAFRRMKKGI